MSKELPSDMVKSFIITLPEAKERQDFMSAQMSARGLPFEFVEAVDGRGFDVAGHPEYDAATRRRNYGRDLKGGELGCLLSHKRLYEKIVAESIPLSFILEDDAVLVDDMRQVIEDLAALPNDSFDIVRFLGSKKLSKARQKIVKPLRKPYTLSRLYGVPGGAHAYVITLTGAKKMLAAMPRSAYPIDTLIGRVWDTKCEALVVMPGPAVNSQDHGSFIGDARFDKSELDVTGLSRTLFPLTRGLFKLHETMMKAWVYWGR